MVTLYNFTVLCFTVWTEGKLKKSIKFIKEWLVDNHLRLQDLFPPVRTEEQ